MNDRTVTRLPSPLAATVLEAMGQDCGPVEAEPYASWAKALAGELLSLQESVCEPVGASVSDRIAAQAPPTSHVAAGADEAEAHPAPDRDSQLGVVDGDADGLYSDGVQHLDHEGYRRSEDGIGCGRCYTYRLECERADCPGARRWPEVAEHVRQSRLSLWQAQR